MKESHAPSSPLPARRTRRAALAATAAGALALSAAVAATAWAQDEPTNLIVNGDFSDGTAPGG
ncbi:hypothetical protein GCM10029992_41170 [Glycomyces albus]